MLHSNLNSMNSCISALNGGDCCIAPPVAVPTALSCVPSLPCDLETGPSKMAATMAVDDMEAKHQAALHAAISNRAYADADANAFSAAAVNSRTLASQAQAVSQQQQVAAANACARSAVASSRAQHQAVCADAANRQAGQLSLLSQQRVGVAAQAAQQAQGAALAAQQQQLVAQQARGMAAGASAQAAAKQQEARMAQQSAEQADAVAAQQLSIQAANKNAAAWSASEAQRARGLQQAELLAKQQWMANAVSILASPSVPHPSTWGTFVPPAAASVPLSACAMPTAAPICDATSVPAAAAAAAASPQVPAMPVCTPPALAPYGPICDSDPLGAMLSVPAPIIPADVPSCDGMPFSSASVAASATAAAAAATPPMPMMPVCAPPIAVMCDPFDNPTPRGAMAYAPSTEVPDCLRLGGSLPNCDVYLPGERRILPAPF